MKPYSITDVEKARVLRQVISIEHGHMNEAMRSGQWQDVQKHYHRREAFKEAFGLLTGATPADLHA